MSTSEISRKTQTLELIDNLLSDLSVSSQAQPQQQICVGIDLGGTKCLIAKQQKTTITNLDKQPVSFSKHLTGENYKLEILLSSLCSFLKKEIETKSIISVGISVCGFVEPNGLVGLCELPNLTNINIVNELQKLFKVEKHKIKCVNDAEASIIYSKDVLFKSTKDICSLIFGTGIGSSFLINGSILRGNVGMGAFLGGSNVLIGEKVKNFDEICGGRAIIKQLEQLNLTPEKANKILKNRNEILEKKEVEKSLEVKCIEKMDEICKYIGICVSNVITLFNPKIIVLSGGLFNFPFFYQKILENVEKHLIFKEEYMKDTQIILFEKFNQMVVLSTLYIAQSL